MAFIGVYKITNNINGKFYIGRSKDIRYRWGDHKKPSIWKQYPNKLLYRAFEKYGLENFSFDIVKFNNTPEETFISEYEFIKKFKPKYNSISLHDGIMGHSEETKEKLSKAHTGKKLSEETKEKLRKINLGNHHTSESKKKIGDAARGRKASEETKRKLSELMMGNKRNLGNKLSEETKRKLSKVHTSKKLSEETKRKLSEFNLGKKLSIETKKKMSKAVIRLLDGKEFYSTEEATRVTGTPQTTIGRHCHNRVKNPEWKFKE